MALQSVNFDQFMKMCVIRNKLNPFSKRAIMILHQSLLIIYLLAIKEYLRKNYSKLAIILHNNSNFLCSIFWVRVKSGSLAHVSTWCPLQWTPYILFLLAWIHAQFCTGRKKGRQASKMTWNFSLESLYLLTFCQARKRKASDKPHKKPNQIHSNDF